MIVAGYGVLKFLFESRYIFCRLSLRPDPGSIGVESSAPTTTQGSE